MIIKSSTSLRNDYGEIASLAKESGEPIYITKNGEGDLVLMSVEAFEQRDELIRLRAKLEVADEQRRVGGGFSMEESRRRLEGVFGGQNA